MENQNEKELLFRRYLDGELSSEEEQKVLHMIADDEEMRDMLRFERTLFQTFSGEPDPESFSVPDQFSSSVMDRIEKRENKVKKTRSSSAVISTLITPKTISFKPVQAIAAVILLTIGIGFFFMEQDETEEFFTSTDFETSTQVVSETESEIWLRFVYFDEDAESMEVAGDFSNWDTISLSREMIGDRKVWTGLIPVTRGEHHYMFIRNGEEWLTDPLATVQRDDGFGNKNAVIYI